MARKLKRNISGLRNQSQTKNSHANETIPEPAPMADAQVNNTTNLGGF